MKAKTLFDAIGVVAAFAAVAQQAHELLSPHMPVIDVGGLVPKPFRQLPRRMGNAASAFAAPIDAPRATRQSPPASPRPERRPQSIRVAA